VHGDWGDCCDEDKATNELSVRQRMRVMSVYRLVDAEDCCRRRKTSAAACPRSGSSPKPTAR
jgi:hypothetical protein